MRGDYLFVTQGDTVESTLQTRRFAQKDFKMSNPFFDHPILNAPYEYPARHWELDEAGQPTQKIIEARRGAKFVTPIPKPKKRKK